MIPFKSIGEDVLIREGARFVRPELISIGNHVMIDDFVLVAGGRGELTEIGNHVHIACFSCMLGGGGFTLGDFCGLAPGCKLFSETGDYVDGGLMNPTVPDQWQNTRVGRIVLGKFVGLGANCVVLPGVTIGEGATVGACSLVVKDIEAWTVNIGIPTRPIRFRNRDEVRQRAEELCRGE